MCEVEYEQILFFAKFCIENNYAYVYTSTEPPKGPETVANYADDYTNLKNPGILVIFKIDKIRIINNHSLDYISGVKRYVEDHKLDKTIIPYFTKPFASNIVLFEKLSDNQRFYFVGLHHYHNPKEEDVKEFQITYLLGKLAYKNQIYDYPVIMCGDLNVAHDDIDV